MSTIFLLCVLIGGTFLICQFVMTLIGLGHEGFDLDAAHVPSDSVPGHVGDALHAEVDHDASGPDHQHGSSWLFGIISFRTLVAATTVFGLTGMTVRSSGVSLPLQLLIAITAAGAAMFAVHWLMRSLYQLGQSGTLRVTNAIGKIGTVSIPIPGHSSGPGKVRLTVQGRLEELPAVTSADESLATGSRVIVIDVVSNNILEVAPYHETS
jgi:hypothetical protein